MQSLWSRTAQTRCTRAGLCINANVTVGRRVGTATPRFRLRISDVFTACYSAMFAAAALADAHVKSNRLAQWDVLIEQAKTYEGQVQLPLENLHESNPARSTRSPSDEDQETHRITGFHDWLHDWVGNHGCHPSEPALAEPLEDRIRSPFETQRTLSAIQRHLTKVENDIDIQPVSPEQQHDQAKDEMTIEVKDEVKDEIKDEVFHDWLQDWLGDPGCHSSESALAESLEGRIRSPFETQRALFAIHRHVTKVEHDIEAQPVSPEQQHDQAKDTVTIEDKDEVMIEVRNKATIEVRNEAKHEVTLKAKDEVRDEVKDEVNEDFVTRLDLMLPTLLREPSKSDRIPRTRTHMEHHQQMITALVVKLVGESNFKSVRSRRLAWLLDQPPTRHVSHLLDKHPPRYDLPTTSAALHETIKLNWSLASIFRTHSHQTLDSVIARICYNLIVCKGAPDIITYNILLQCFTMLNLHRLARVVVHSLVFESNFRPDALTIALTLEHYTKSNDERAFRAFSQRMRCERMTCRIATISRERFHDPAIQQWAMSPSVIFRNGKLHEKAPRDLRVFHALINGCLSFNDVKTATVYTKQAFKEGRAIGRVTFTRLVDSLPPSYNGAHCIQARPAFRLLKDLILLHSPGNPLSPELFQDLSQPFRKLIRLAGIHVDHRKGVYFVPPDMRIHFERLTYFCESLFGKTLFHSAYAKDKIQKTLTTLYSQSASIIAELEKSCSTRQSITMLQSIGRQLSANELCHHSNKERSMAEDYASSCTKELRVDATPPKVAAING